MPVFSKYYHEILWVGSFDKPFSSDYGKFPVVIYNTKEVAISCRTYVLDNSQEQKISMLETTLIFSVPENYLEPMFYNLYYKTKMRNLHKQRKWLLLRVNMSAVIVPHSLAGVSWGIIFSFVVMHVGHFLWLV